MPETQSERPDFDDAEHALLDEVWAEQAAAPDPKLLIRAMLAVADLTDSDEEAQAAIAALTERLSGGQPQRFAEGGEEIVLPGPEGRRAAELLQDAQAYGVATLAEVCAPAVERLLASGGKGAALFTQEELNTLAEALAGTLAAADLLGRSRLRELVRREVEQFSEAPAGRVAAFAEFADPVPVLSPEAALDYFRSLVPQLGVDPQRYGDDQRRAAFTLATATEEALLAGVQETVANWMETGGGRALVGRTPDGQTIRFERHARAGPQYVAVLADTNRLDQAWSKDESYYIPPGGGGAEIKGRRAGFERFLATGKRVEAPIVDASGGVVSVEDGRHRLSVLRDLGIDQVPVMVPADQAQQFRRQYGSTLPGEPSDLTGPEQVQEVLDAAGVTPASPARAEMIFRTNAADAYNQGSFDEFRSPDVQEDFPEWEYLNPDDSRSRPAHAERNHQRYPSSLSFNEVRGTDISEVANCRCTFRPVHKSEATLRR